MTDKFHISDGDVTIIEGPKFPPVVPRDVSWSNFITTDFDSARRVAEVELSRMPRDVFAPVANLIHGYAPMGAGMLEDFSEGRTYTPTKPIILTADRSSLRGSKAIMQVQIGTGHKVRALSHLSLDPTDPIFTFENKAYLRCMGAFRYASGVVVLLMRYDGVWEADSVSVGGNNHFGAPMLTGGDFRML